MELINKIEDEIKSKRDKKGEILYRDKEAPIYDTVIIPEYQQRVEISSCLERLNPRKNELILDAGCGTGRFVHEMIMKGARVIAIDYSKEPLKICKERCNDLSIKPFIIRADICNLPLKSEIVDKVLSTGVFEHIPSYDDRVKALREMRRVLNSNGRLVITTYNYDLPCRLFGNKMGYHAGRIYYYNYSYSEFKKILSLVFDKVEICGILNFLKYCWSVQSRLNRLNTILKKIGFFLIMEKLDKTIEKTPLSYIMGHFLCACIKK